MKAAFERAWEKNSTWLLLLKPFEFLFRQLVARRRRAYLAGKKDSYRAPVPVIIVGNITVGGVGKTPLVIATAKHLTDTGRKPGIVSRGYGAAPGEFPRQVDAHSDVNQVGDEPLVIAQRTGCPMVIDPDRPRAIKTLLAEHDCDVVISDDGLQHYAMARDVEIAVIDGKQGLFNGAMLPVGPLREPRERLQSVSFIVSNGANQRLELGEGYPPHYVMNIAPGALINLKSGRALDDVSRLADQSIHAVAGIGSPQRFFTTLQELGFRVSEHRFPDHHQFTATDLAFPDDKPIVMTEKDAVKCSAFATENCWYLPIDAHLPESFYSALALALTKD